MCRDICNISISYQLVCATSVRITIWFLLLIWQTLRAWNTGMANSDRMMASHILSAQQARFQAIKWTQQTLRKIIRKVWKLVSRWLKTTFYIHLSNALCYSASDRYNVQWSRYFPLKSSIFQRHIMQAYSKNQTWKWRKMFLRRCCTVIRPGIWWRPKPRPQSLKHIAPQG